MAISASGNFAHASIAQLFAAIGSGRVTGTLTVSDQGRSYVSWWENGNIVDADSPTPEDQLGRVLLAANMISRNNLGASIQRMAQNPEASQLDILAEMKALPRSRVDEAARMGLMQRVLRAFALPNGDYRIQVRHHDRSVGVPLNARCAIYHGLHQHFDDGRFASELARFNGARIKLKELPDAWLRSFEFGDTARRLIELLGQQERTLDQLRVEATRAGLVDVVNATLVALYVTGGLEIASGKTGVKTPSQPMPAVATPKPVATPKRVAPEPRATPAPVPNPKSEPETISKDQVLNKYNEIMGNADHFQLLGIDRDASSIDIKKAYFAVAKLYHPDRLATYNLADMRSQVERIFARMSEAFSVLNDDKKREEYLAVLDQGGEKIVNERLEQETQMALRILSAEDAFLEGEMALRRQSWNKARDCFAKAIELNPEEGEHHAALAWATWCVATDKKLALDGVKAGITKGLKLNPKCVPAYFYLGQVLKFVGDASGAEEQFRRALKLDPDHTESQTEMRIIEMRRRRG